MEEDIVLKIKEYESLEVIKIICIIFGLFLFILGAMYELGESILMVCFMWTFSVILDSINLGEFIVSKKGVKSKTFGYIQYRKIYRLEKKGKDFIIYSRESKKPIRVFFSNKEDIYEIEKVYKYIDSKIKGIEEEKREHEEFIEKISK